MMADVGPGDDVVVILNGELRAAVIVMVQVPVARDGGDKPAIYTLRVKTGRVGKIRRYRMNFAPAGTEAR